MNPDRSSRFRQQINQLRVDAHQAVRRYVEKHESSLRRLNQDEFYDILIIYLDALFECGEYDVFLSRVDEGIAMTVDRPEYGRREENLFHHLLFRKAAACYHKGKEDQCMHILRELLRLDPEHALAARFLVQCVNRSRKSARQTIRAISIGLFLSTVLVLMLETLWIRPFLTEEVALIVWVRNSLFISGWVVLVGGESLLFGQSRYVVKRFLRSLPRRGTISRRKTTSWL